MLAPALATPHRAARLRSGHIVESP